MRNIALFMFLLFFSSSDSFALADSIGIKTMDGKKYIMHQVEKSQGLFAISKRYGVSVEDIKAANDNVEVLALDQIVLVPMPKLVVEEKKFTHEVEKGETLYKIARLYNVSVDNLRKWNNLDSDAIKEGDELQIVQIVKYVEVEKQGVKPEEAATKPDIPENYQRKNPKATEVVEEGIATWIEDPTVNSRQALALHKKAPTGTIIKVTNVMNGKEIYVKVVGKIPDQAVQSNEIIRLSKYAAKQLKIKDQITRVKLNYYQE